MRTTEAGLAAYLQPGLHVDSNHPEIVHRAAVLAAGAADAKEIARRCFEFVRDDIRHSWDYRQNPVTCTASDVLRHGTGYCYAKSHLLAALLRANGIPAGLCYQRLSIAGNGPPYCLHGLNAVHLPDVGWYRIDARGNKPGVDARFCPPSERLAFPIVHAGEIDFDAILAEPLPLVVEALTRHPTVEAVAAHLPDAISLSPNGQ